MIVRNALATQASSVSLAEDMSKKLPELAKIYTEQHGKTKSGKKEWTNAVWQYFEDFRKTEGWALWPKEAPIGGRAKGEFLTDFSLFDETFGFRIACESEWGNLQCIKWAFEKLAAVKADTKVLIFERTHTEDGKLPTKVEELLKERLASCGHHHPGHEVYLFIQFDHDNSRSFFWEPLQSGRPEEIQIVSI
jgi:hypothetical protein